MTHKREIEGSVIKISGIKTVAVLVERRVTHPKYGKIVKKFKKYLIHDEKNVLKVGDKVVAIECRPFSKRKTFRFKRYLGKESN